MNTAIKVRPKSHDESFFEEKQEDTVRKLIVNNRELLRNFKSLKKLLLQRKVDLIEVDADEGFVLELSIKKRKKEKPPFESLLELIGEEPIKIQRPEADLFDYL